MLNRDLKIKSLFRTTRTLIISIDGDGFSWPSEIDNEKAGNIFLEEIIKNYPFKFTASVIIKDIVRDKNNFNLAKEIFSQGNVEAASHSWNHPRNWQKKGINLKHEIDESVDFINKNLLPKNKKVKLFLWTGRCNPSEEALAMVSKLKIVNLNGNNIDLPFLKIGYYRQFMSRAYPDWHYLDLKKVWVNRDSPNQLRLTSRRLDGYKKIVTYFEENPQIPVHLWLHWYSAVRPDSLGAIKYVLDWCLKQNLKPTFSSNYIKDLV